MAWGKAGSETLTTAGDTMTISDLTKSKFNQYMSHELISSGKLDSRMRLGDGSVDTGSNYADRISNNGGADGTQVSETDIHILNGNIVEDHFIVGYFLNIATEEKLHIGFAMGNLASGAGSAPQRMEIVSKWANTSVQFDNIQSLNVGTGDYATDSNLSALGSDLTPAAAVTFPSDVPDYTRFEETDTRKMYTRLPASVVTLDEDFSSDNFTDSDSTRIGVSGGVLNFQGERQYTVKSCSRSITSVSDTSFVFRTKMVLSDLTVGAGYSDLFIGLSTNDYTANPRNDTGDSIGIRVLNYSSGGKTFKAMSSDNSAALSPSSYSDFTTSVTTGTYYLQIKRTSATSATIGLYSDSDYSTLIEEEILTISSSLTGLNNISILPDVWSDYVTTCKITGTLDDLKIYDEITSVSEAGWKEKGQN